MACDLNGASLAAQNRVHDERNTGTENSSGDGQQDNAHADDGTAAVFLAQISHIEGKEGQHSGDDDSDERADGGKGTVLRGAADRNEGGFLHRVLSRRLSFSGLLIGRRF